MLTTENYKFKKPELTDSPPDITVLNTNFDIIDTELFNRVVKESGKGLSANDFTDILLDKLNGIAAGANKYTHPSTHPATIIVEDSTHRFLTDEERKIIKAWEEFKANGGSIGGDVTVKGTINIEGFLKSANGYTKLPNGFILQWGVLSTTLENRFKNLAVKFPIQFSSDKPKVFINCDWLSGTTSPANIQCNASNLAINGFTATFKVDDSMFASSEFSAQWFAIGY